MKATLGRIVIYKDSNGMEHAAIITHVWNDTCVNLKAFGKDLNNSDMFVTSCTQGDSTNQWQWPKRVE